MSRRQNESGVNGSLKASAAAMLAGMFCLSALADLSLPPTTAVTNRAPLLRTPFVALPLGSVRAQGWLLKQCELQRDGLTGRAEELYPEDLGPNSAWLGGAGEAWERGPYYVKGLVTLAYTLNDDALKQKAQKWIEWLLGHQRADGYIGPAHNDDWWPRMVATYALKDYYEATGDARVPPVLSNYFHYMLGQLPSHPLADWAKSRAGDEMEVALWLYNRNHDTSLLSLVQLLRRQAYDWPGIFSSNHFLCYGADFQPKHNVNIEQALKMPVVYYQLSGESSDRDALALGLKNLMCENRLPFGINSGTEFVSGDASIQGVELCAIVEAMLSLETAERITGDPSLGDRLEMIAFNALPAALANNIKAIQYYTLPNNVIAIAGGHGFNQDYPNGTVPGPDSGYPCCRCNFHMGWPKLVQNSWAATDDCGLAALAYAPTVADAIAGHRAVRITEDTAYPFEEQVRLRISTEEPVAFPLELRIPGWCNHPSVSVNGRAERNVKTGSFHRLQRTWKSGDTVVVNLPMLIQTQMGPSRSVAISRGPLVYSLRIGEDWSVRKHDPARFDEFEVRPTTPWNYALQLDPANPASDIAVQNDGTPANPFDPAEPSVALRAKARQLSDWTIGWRGTHAFEPPVSPVASTNPLTDVVLVPFGSRHLRVSWFPILGTAQPAAGEFSETFDSTWPQRWTVFGGNWLASGSTLSSVPASANGAKALAMATAFTNFILEADVSVGPAGDAGLVFRVSKPDIGANAYCGYYAGISANARKLVFGCASNAWREIASAPAELVANGRCHLKVVAQGAHFQIFLGDKPAPLIEARDGSFSGGMIGVRDYCTDEKQSLSAFANVKATETGSFGLNRYSVP